MIIARKNAYQEDISPAGATLITDQCAVYEITISSDDLSHSIVSISNSVGYDASLRLEKAVLSSSMPTVCLSYPGGKLFTTGFSAISNGGSVNISVTYE